ncbi:MAG: hypothetical protein CBB71_13445 [Rhodopirellula sp. TMED11]|nr:MAG: hypothetical protein CBB71_13445 [Rhodopirellula sp. TMED11]
MWHSSGVLGAIVIGAKFNIERDGVIAMQEPDLAVGKPPPFHKLAVQLACRLFPSIVGEYKTIS